MKHGQALRTANSTGIRVGGGLLAAGILLQLSVGPVRWDRVAFPVNVILLLAFLALLGGMYALRRRVPLFEWLMHLPAAVAALGQALVLTLVMGLVMQRDGGIPWLSQMLGFWPFVLTYAWVAVVVGLASVNHLLRFRVKEIPFLLNHAGLFLALVCGALGGADRQELRMTVREGETVHLAEDRAGAVREPGLAVELHDFIMEEYPLQPGDRMRVPRRFASAVTVHTQSGGVSDAVVEVNKPLKADGWKIYQYGYDESAGTGSRISILQLVRDPWLPFVFAGICLMLAGALSLFFFMAPGPKKKED